ncbi:MAG: HAMP domain-containing histidine kinase [Chitinivibrionales bacterium]|nr:HAMP domain-containing histidine kinase [Chitinivibrionales bacterium]
MVNRSIMYTLAVVGASLVIIFTVAGVLFSQALERVENYSRQRMYAAAEFSRQYIDLLFASPQEPADSVEVDSWLDNFITGSGFEHIVVCDTNKRILFSSHELLHRGEDFSFYGIDDSLFDQVLQLFTPGMTETVKIGSSQFASAYYPGYINDQRCLISVSADQNYFTEAGRYRTVMVGGGLFLVLFSAILFSVLIIIDKRRRVALQRLAHNERLAFLGRTSAELAHELKNPLGIMKASVDVLRQRFDSSRSDTVFTFLSDEIMRLKQMIESILAFSRDKTLNRETFAANDVLAELVASFAMQYPKLAVTLSIDKELKLDADRHAFRIIASNLLQNAAGVLNGVGTISISSQQDTTDTQELQLLFTDSGPGIDRSIRARIFEPFVQSSTAIAGTGLGLAIVKSLCDSLGWRIELLNWQAGQTCFAVVIKEGLWQRF